MATPTNPTPTKVFAFTVDPKGQFTYDPSGDWAYGHRDTIRFQTRSGPFTIDFLPASLIPYDGFKPLGGPLTSVQEGAQYHADTTVQDDLTEVDRETLIKANVSSQHPKGFVGRYRYAINVTVGNQTFSDDQKNGTYSC
jgi:hypothetical protein